MSSLLRLVAHWLKVVCACNFETTYSNNIGNRCPCRLVLRSCQQNVVGFDYLMSKDEQTFFCMERFCLLNTSNKRTDTKTLALWLWKMIAMFLRYWEDFCAAISGYSLPQRDRSNGDVNLIFLVRFCISAFYLCTYKKLVWLTVCQAEGRRFETVSMSFFAFSEWAFRWRKPVHIWKSI